MIPLIKGAYRATYFTVFIYMDVAECLAYERFENKWPGKDTFKFDICLN
jgi:hypothetical protein